jgi:colanic acid biosynthesis glycosyl transferase WcaI
MHILFLNEFYHPDICASAVVTTDHLSRIAQLRSDWQITVIAGNRAWNDPQRVYPSEEIHDGVRILRVERPPVKSRSILERGVGFLKFLSAAREKSRSLAQVDLVIGTTAPPLGGRLARSIARERRCPYIYKVFDLYPDLAVTLEKLRVGSLTNLLWRFDDTRTTRRAAAVVTIADAMAARIRQTRNLRGAPLHCIHDGFDDRRLKIKGAVRDRQGQFVVQYAGNMGLSHSFTTILRAARLLKSHDDVLFQFVGDGPGRGLLAEQLPPNATLNGFAPAEKLGDLLAGTHICLVSQHQDMWDQALPYKVYSILAAGKPLIFIGSPQSEVVAWLMESGAGVHCPQGDARTLAEQILTLKKDATARIEMGQRARSLFMKRFNSNLAAQRWIELIESILKKT